MGTYRIEGGRRLEGELTVSGAKNAVLPILAASVISEGENLFCGCPEISDVDSMLRILRALGCSAERDADLISVDSSGMTECGIPEELMKEMRSSVFLAGSLLSRFGEAVISDPGGCRIGSRPIDLHIRGLQQMGAEVRRDGGRIIMRAKKLKPAEITLSYPSVGATENLLLAAVSAKGKTTIRNSAKEPEIVDLQNYINSCGGCVNGAGSGTIEIEGGLPLSGCRHRIMADRIEAGTYLIMTAACGGRITLKGISRVLIEPLIRILECGGYEIVCGKDRISLESNGGERIAECIVTAPYPGFPTDLHPQLAVLLALRGAGSRIEEAIFESRLGYAKQLVKMGADIEISQKQVIIKSSAALRGADVEAEDLRGGAALVIAALAAEGTSSMRNTEYIRRGYGGFEEKIRSLGGEITEYA